MISVLFESEIWLFYLRYFQLYLSFLTIIWVPISNIQYSNICWKTENKLFPLTEIKIFSWLSVEGRYPLFQALAMRDWLLNRKRIPRYCESQCSKKRMYRKKAFPQKNRIIRRILLDSVLHNKIIRIMLIGRQVT